MPRCCRHGALEGWPGGAQLERSPQGQAALGRPGGWLVGLHVGGFADVEGQLDSLKKASKVFTALPVRDCGSAEPPVLWPLHSAKSPYRVLVAGTGHQGMQIEALCLGSEQQRAEGGLLRWMP